MEKIRSALHIQTINERFSTAMQFWRPVFLVWRLHLHFIFPALTEIVYKYASPFNANFLYSECIQ